jgi:hypothetical protein
MMEQSKEAPNEKYLGLPVYVRKSKIKIFGYLKDRIWKLISGRMEKACPKWERRCL